MYRAARACPSRLFIGVDANGAALAERSRRAAAKPSRGGAPNALFVRASVDALPEELAGLASRVTVLFPWGSLLRAVVAPEGAVLEGLAAIGRPGARIEIVFAAMLERERAAAAASGIPPLDEAHLARLPRAYAEAGFDVAVRPSPREEIAERGTTWAKRLAQDPARRFYAIEGARA